MMTRDVSKRLTIDQILEHPWFEGTPEQSQVTIFNKSERTLLIKEFLYNEDPEKWENQVELKKYELEENGYYHLDNLYSTKSDELKNASTKSVILAPFNTTMSAEDSED